MLSPTFKVSEAGVEVVLLRVGDLSRVQLVLRSDQHLEISSDWHLEVAPYPAPNLLPLRELSHWSPPLAPTALHAQTDPNQGSEHFFCMIRS